MFSLPDQSFFNLVHNYLGDIKTPFNKHDLLDRLELFLLKNTERILSLMDKDDVALLSAIDLLDGSSEAELFAVFKDDYSYYAFYSQLLNLEERMLICKADGIVISPIFRRVLREKVIDCDVLFDAKPKTLKQISGYPWFSIPVVSAFTSWLLNENDILKKDLSFKKKFKEEVGSLFGLSCSEILKNVMIRKSLLYLSGRRLVPVKENIKALFELDDEKISEFFINSFLVSNPAEWVVYANMRADRVYSEKGFCRFVSCSAIAAKLPVPDWKKIVHKFVDAGLVTKSTSGICRLEYVSPKKRGRAVIQPDFSLFVEGHLSLEENMVVALCSEIRKLGDLSRYEITRESFMRGIHSGVNTDRFISIVESLSETAIPQNIVYSLKSWEEECKGVSIYRGCVIKTDARISKLLDGNSSFRGYLCEKLGDGIFLISEDDLQAAVKIVESVSGQNLMTSWEKKSQDKILVTEPIIPSSERFLGYHKPEVHSPKVCKINLEKRLKALDMPKIWRKVLADRVKRKLIFSEDQIVNSTVRYEMTEAKGLDYAGKIHLCQYVIEHGNSFLELSICKGKRIIMKPELLKKSDADILLVGEEIPDGRHLQVELRRVWLVRKVCMSLMG